MQSALWTLGSESGPQANFLLAARMGVCRRGSPRGGNVRQLWSPPEAQELTWAMQGSAGHLAGSTSREQWAQERMGAEEVESRHSFYKAKGQGEKTRQELKWG